jgi:hypothetical protein
METIIITCTIPPIAAINSRMVNSLHQVKSYTQHGNPFLKRAQKPAEAGNPEVRSRTRHQDISVSIRAFTWMNRMRSTAILSIL